MREVFFEQPDGDVDSPVAAARDTRGYRVDRVNSPRQLGSAIDDDAVVRAEVERCLAEVELHSELQPTWDLVAGFAADGACDRVCCVEDVSHRDYDSVCT